MSRHRDFDAARAENVGEPLTFRLAGRDFTIPEVPAGPVLDLAAALGTDNVVIVFGRFLYQAVPEAQHDALTEALREVDIATALAVSTWIIEEAVSRPLGNAPVSPDTSSNDGAVSKLAAASAGWEPRS